MSSSGIDISIRCPVSGQHYGCEGFWNECCDRIFGLLPSRNVAHMQRESQPLCTATYCGAGRAYLIL